MKREDVERYRNDYKGSYENQLQAGLFNTVTINVSDLCNFKCIMCDVPENNRKSTFIEAYKIDNFLKIMKDKGAECCILGSGSEFTIYPEWKKIVEMSIKYFPDTILFTNGSRLSSADCRFLVESGLTRLFVSLDAHMPETFQLIRGFNMLDKIKQSIEEINLIKKQKNSISPLTRVSFVIQKQNQTEVQDFLDYWITKVDSVEFQDMYNITEFRDKDFVNKLDKVPENELKGKPSCHKLFSYVSLWANGNISPCCTGYGRDSNEISLGNINDENILQNVLNKREKLQKAFISQEWKNIPNTCKHCLRQTMD